MYKLDLLKGQAIPVRFRPQHTALTAIATLAPVIGVIVAAGLYLNNRIEISVCEQQIQTCLDKSERLAEQTGINKSLQLDKAVADNRLADVETALARQVQWSPIIMTVVDTIPDSIILTKMRIERRTVKKEVPRKDDPEKTEHIDLPARTLHMTVTGADRLNQDLAVKRFREEMWASKDLGPQLDNITVSQRTERSGAESIVSYDISCFFKMDI